MEAFNTAAADAEARAMECRVRATRLADHHQVGAEDVRLARAALARAQHRAEAARRRLTAARQRHLGAPAEAVTGTLGHADADAPMPDLATLRAAARELVDRDLYVAYFALGGNCTRLELEAFAYAALELPSQELAVLAHAVWEMTEL